MRHPTKEDTLEFFPVSTRKNILRRHYYTIFCVKWGYYFSKIKDCGETAVFGIINVSGDCAICFCALTVFLNGISERNDLTYGTSEKINSLHRYGWYTD